MTITEQLEYEYVEYVEYEYAERVLKAMESKT